ncbi:MAG TPA: PadR family transcriptional regulator [Chloroflexi bacterium]|nr:PadR family transcriptional regulator [Chloroflexota bacterium]
MVKRKRTGFGTYPLRYLALGLLMGGSAHGYQLDQTLGEVFGMIWKAGQTKLYVTLSSLEKEGLLRTEMERQENRPDRKVYHLTQDGRREFQEWVTKPVNSLRAARVELLAKLRFYHWLKLPDVEKLIQAQGEIYQMMINEWQEDQVREDDPFLRQVYDFRINQAQFIIKWLGGFQGEIYAEEPDR